MRQIVFSSLASLASAAVLCLAAAAVVASCSVPEASVSASREHYPKGDCFDGKRTDYETDEDCGGPDCDPCEGGEECFDSTDCVSPLGCVAQTVEGKKVKVCATEHCFDDELNEGESDVDCGGGGCPKCEADRICTAPEDCVSSVCLDGTCQLASCEDDVVNQDESDTDCGGGCAGCPGGRFCRSNEDCASAQCDGGICNSLCRAGTAECDNDPSVECETNITTDPQHCGGCNAACELAHATAACSAGTCSVIEDCDAGYDDCNGEVADGCEINVRADIENCGECNLRCPPINGTPECVNGACQIECAAGWVNCNGDALSDGCETRTSDDVTNCGECNNVCSPRPGETAFCKDGVCGSTACDLGLGDCDGDGECTDDIATNPLSCGSCGKRCTIANGTPECTDGACGVASCEPGWGDCDDDPDNGCETNLNTTTAHCGKCDQACAYDNAVAACDTGECVFRTCSGGYADCNETTDDGCETDLTSDGDHCGACSNECAYPHARGTCVDSGCQMGACDQGYAACDTDFLNGCEAVLATDANNCGECGVVCSSSHVSQRHCISGECRPDCSALTADCDTTINNGCETPTNTLNDCGACNASCPENTINGTNTCEAGVCEVGSCDAGYGDCDPDRAGCETDTTSSLAHCGGCDQPCSFAHAGAACSGGDCTMGNCDANYVDCDGLTSTGCEASLTSGYADFDGDKLANGCELRLEYRATTSDPTGNQIEFEFRICNAGGTAADIGSYAMKYWYSDETDTGSGPRFSGKAPSNATISATGAAASTGHSHVITVPLPTSLTAAANACSISTMVRLTASSGTYTKTNDASYDSNTTFHVSGKLGFFKPDGTLVIGTAY